MLLLVGVGMDERGERLKMVNKRRYRSAVTEAKQQRLCYLIAGTVVPAIHPRAFQNIQENHTKINNVCASHQGQTS